jgi:hypothetical protein
VLRGGRADRVAAHGEVGDGRGVAQREDAGRPRDGEVGIDDQAAAVGLQM